MTSNIYTDAMSDHEADFEEVLQDPSLFARLLPDIFTKREIEHIDLIMKRDTRSDACREAFIVLLSKVYVSNFPSVLAALDTLKHAELADGLRKAVQAGNVI
jgi:hypothetical protein